MNDAPPPVTDAPPAVLLSPEEIRQQESYEVVFTGPSKVDLIQSLIVAIEQRKVSWPAEWTDLTDELMRYEYHYTGTRRLDYNAPSGFHDDNVIALALAISLRAKPHIAPASPIFLPRPPPAPPPTASRPRHWSEINHLTERPSRCSISPRGWMVS